MKLGALAIIGIISGVLALAAGTYFGLDYLRKTDPYKNVRHEESRKQAGTARNISPSQPRRAPPLAAPPPVMVETDGTNNLSTNKVSNTVTENTNSTVGDALSVGNDVPVNPNIPNTNTPATTRPAEVGIVPTNSRFAPAPATNQASAPSAPISINTPRSTQARQSIEIAPAPSTTAAATPAIPQEILNPTAPAIPDTSRPQQQRQRPAAPRPTAYATGRYLFRNLSGTTGDNAFTDSGGGSGGGSSSSANINLQTFAPEGEPIDICTVNNVASNQMELDVVAAVWTPFYWNGRKILDIGEHILGSASAGHNRDRLLVNWKKVLFKDGKTLPINGIALNTDGTLGLKGYKVGNIFLQAVGPILTDLLSGAAQALQNQVSISQSSLYGSVTNINPSNIGQQALGYGANKALDRLSNLLEQDAEDNAPYIFVPAGTRGQVYLKSYIDVSLADYGK
ncbi:MAG: TrbI/VirB10 family protein [Verrucomicrobium sp.]|nr:TrbI/VirB10 family protein [Verrucomicrobium sp.]